MYQDYCDGGLRVTNVEVMFKSLRLAWIQRLLKNDDEEENSWSTIPNFYFNKYGGLKFLLRSNYDLFPSNLCALRKKAKERAKPNVNFFIRRYPISINSSSNHRPLET